MPPSARPIAGLLLLPLLLVRPAWTQTGWLSDPSSMKANPALLQGFPGSEGPSQPLDQTGLFEPVIDSLYILGPGDNLGVGLGTKTVYVSVNPEGIVILDNAGPIAVGDQTLREARKLIISKVSRSFKEEKVFVTLNRAKKIKASIVGAVQSPGLYQLEGTSRLTDILQLAGGFGANASRKVSIHKRDGAARAYDLNAYFRRNDLSQNPYLGAGDQIRLEEVDLEKPTLRISENDQINTVQMEPGQNAFDLIAEYFSYRKYRNWDYIKVYQDGAKEASVIDKKAARAFIPEPGSNLELHSYKPLVFVSGAVARPTALEFNANFNALDYISHAGIMPMTGNFRRVRVIDAKGEERTVDTSKDRIFAGDHLILPQSAESRIREYLPFLAAVAGIVSSVALTIITINANNTKN